MEPSATPNRSWRVTHFLKECVGPVLFSKPNQRSRKESSGHGLLRQVTMRSLRGGGRFVDSPQGQVGFAEGQMRVNFALRDVQRFESFLQRLLIPPGTHQVGHQNAAPD